ncbi:MAG TPA: 1,4-alpha-glucan branching protein GlgB [Candidatus Polarisedimenticolaceae bacterium]
MATPTTREPRRNPPKLPASAADPQEAAAIASGRHAEPHRFLGAHAAREGRRTGVVVRTFHPEAASCELLVAGHDPAPMHPTDALGVFQAFVAGAKPPLAYRVRFTFPNGATWERDDPYRFLPTLGDIDLHLFNEGTHRRLWEVLGARPLAIDGVEGAAFAVWAPNAERVSVVGDFCRWDGRLYPMRRMGASGVFELFVPGVHAGALYKFEILTREGALRLKTDPFAQAMEQPPQTASRVIQSTYVWGDDAWMQGRPARDWPREAMAVYEVHLGSWARVPEEGNRPLTYREVAPRLAAHAKHLGFTHVEFLPVAEHPFTGSWGYQVSGYYAPTSRFGTPDDFRFLVDTLHREGIGVIVDWVPAHFPKDDFALRRFDGTAVYEHDDPRQGEHPDWGTLIFNYGRPEVRNFLVANALYWLKEFHVDGLRVDAVASMLYLDYSRKAGEWVPNRFGGRENLDAIEFFRELNRVVAEESPGAFTVAEESTAWPGVTKTPQEGGLGFLFKWNMGWMHDTLEYFKRDPIHRRWHQDQLTFAMLYEYSERFTMPLSHDEVVHLKGSLLRKMPGDEWQRFANLRLLLAYMYLRPGKKLLFMGSEIAPWTEWNHDQSLDWHLLDAEPRAGYFRYFAALGRLYHEHACLWRRDHEPEGFRWVDCSDRDASIVSFRRIDGEQELLVALNLTPTPREAYRIGAPRAGRWECVFSSDAPEFGGSGFESSGFVQTEAVPQHGLDQSFVLRLPPLGAIVLAPR